MRIQGNRRFAPFSWGDISTLTGVGGPPYTMGNMVAQSTIINKFSKIKPVIHSSPGILSEADFKSTGWGFGYNGIPSYANWSSLRAALVAGITAGAVWQYQKPTGSNWYRSHDFNGYVPLSEAWRMGNSGDKTLYFPFDGALQVSDNRCGPYDTVKYVTLTPISPDGDDDGLLYLNDFASMGTGYYNYVNWYLGILLVSKGLTASSADGAYLVNDSQTIQARINSDDYPSIDNVPFPVTIGGSVSGDYYLYPVLVSRSHSTTRFATVTTGWGNDAQGPGRMILLDGYRLPVYCVNTEAGNQGKGFALTINSIAVAGGNTTFNITIKNATTSPITVQSNLFGYFTSEAVFDDAENIYDNVTDALTAWISSGTKYTNGIAYGSSYCARFVDFYSAFYSANSSSNVIASGASVTFNRSIPYTSDPLGNDYDGPHDQLDICYQALINGTSSRKTF